MSAKKSSSDRAADFSEPKLFLVEGKDDQELIAGLVDHLGLSGFQVHAMGGKSKWQAKTRAIAADFAFQDNVRVVVMVRDCDESADGAWTSCQDALRRSGLTMPDSHNVLTPTTDGSPRTAIVLLPGHNLPGALEEYLIPALDRSRLECVESYLACLAANSLQHSSGTKATLQVYLAGLREPVRDLSVAVAAGAIDLDHSHFDGLRTLLAEIDAV